MSKYISDLPPLCLVETYWGEVRRVFNESDEEERYQAFKERLKEENPSAVHRGEE